MPMPNDQPSPYSDATTPCPRPRTFGLTAVDMERFSHTAYVDPHKTGMPSDRQLEKLLLDAAALVSLWLGDVDVLDHEGSLLVMEAAHALATGSGLTSFAKMLQEVAQHRSATYRAARVRAMAEVHREREMRDGGAEDTTVHCGTDLRKCLIARWRGFRYPDGISDADRKRVDDAIELLARCGVEAVVIDPPPARTIDDPERHKATLDGAEFTYAAAYCVAAGSVQRFFGVSVPAARAADSFFGADDKLAEKAAEERTLVIDGVDTKVYCAAWERAECCSTSACARYNVTFVTAAEHERRQWMQPFVAAHAADLRAFYGRPARFLAEVEVMIWAFAVGQYADLLKLAELYYKPGPATSEPKGTDPMVTYEPLRPCLEACVKNYTAAGQLVEADKARAALDVVRAIEAPGARVPEAIPGGVEPQHMCGLPFTDQLQIRKVRLSLDTIRGVVERITRDGMAAGREREVMDAADMAHHAAVAAQSGDLSASIAALAKFAQLGAGEPKAPDARAADLAAVVSAIKSLEATIAAPVRVSASQAMERVQLEELAEAAQDPTFAIKLGPFSLDLFLTRT